MKIQHSRPYLGSKEHAAVAAVLHRGQLAQGTLVVRLEDELSGSVGHRYGIAVSSGTAALYCALRALGIGNGDVVVIPAYVCTALLNAVVMTGATPRLADVDPATGNTTPELVRTRLTKKTKAAIVPHLFGYPADAAGVERLGIPVIEDCAQCVGDHKNGRPVGGLTAMSVFSFYATKLIAAGEGGMVATSDRTLRERVVALREYDKRDTWTPAFNFKLSEVHAALALTQLHALPKMLRLRKAVAGRYRTQLSCGAVRLPPDDQVVYYRFVVRLAQAIRPITAALRATGIECGPPVYKPLHWYLKLPGFPGAEQFHTTALSLPMHPGLTAKETTAVAQTLCRLTKGGP